MDQKLTGETDISEEEIVDGALTIAGAAVDTTSSLLTFALKMLSIHPGFQQRLYEETCEVFQEENRAVTTADLPRQEFCH